MASLEAVRIGRFEFVEIILGMNVLVTLPYLLKEVSTLSEVLGGQGAGGQDASIKVRIREVRVRLSHEWTPYMLW